MKIGIITHYYKSENYGGNLQAYALQRYLSKKYTVEQICYQNIHVTQKGKKQLLKELGFLRFCKKGCKHILNKLRAVFVRKDARVEALLEKRKRAISVFNEKIPHSNICYNARTIKEAEAQYDCFITGSDQVWHPMAVNEAYLLNFVTSKPKISYAASLAIDELTDVQKEKMRSALKDYRAISVREENAVTLLQDIVEQPIEWVIDPVFLLDKEEWSELANRFLVKEKYIFCYFLGASKKNRKLAKAYASEKNLKIVTLPHVLGGYQSCDKNFGDIPLYEIDPIDFISLIKNAECIFTDSFHALAFCRIFEKQYFVFNREGHSSMNSRIYSICQLYNERMHFCDDKQKMRLDYLTQQKLIDYTGPFDLFEKKKAQSLHYLWTHLSEIFA